MKITSGLLGLAMLAALAACTTPAEPAVSNTTSSTTSSATTTPTPTGVSDPAPSAVPDPAPVAPTAAPDPAPTAVPDPAPVPAPTPNVGAGIQLEVPAPLSVCQVIGTTIEAPDNIHAVCAYGERTDIAGNGEGWTLITGHTTVDGSSTGVLENIIQLHVGDVVSVGGGRWVVSETKTVPANQLPDNWFAEGGPRRLILSTCHLPQPGQPYTDTDLVRVEPL